MPALWEQNKALSKASWWSLLTENCSPSRPFLVSLTPLHQWDRYASCRLCHRCRGTVSVSWINTLQRVLKLYQMSVTNAKLCVSSLAVDCNIFADCFRTYEIRARIACIWISTPPSRVGLVNVLLRWDTEPKDKSPFFMSFHSFSLRVSLTFFSRPIYTSSHVQI